MARPTKYSPELCQKLFEYAKTTTDAIPTLEGFAAFIEVDPDTITNWQAEHKEFFGAVKSVMGIQKVKLIDCGLKGEYNPAVTIFLLKNNHGMTDKLQQEVSGPNGGPQQHEHKVALAPDEAYKAMLG